MQVRQIEGELHCQQLGEQNLHWLSTNTILSAQVKQEIVEFPLLAISSIQDTQKGTAVEQPTQVPLNR